MTRESLVERLLELPAAIEAAERAVLAAEEQRREAAEALQHVEDDLLLDPERITGKNAEARAAQIRVWTGEERHRVTTADYAANEARIQLRFLTNEMGVLKDVARLIAASDE